MTLNSAKPRTVARRDAFSAEPTTARNTELMQALVAAYAYMAHADGEVSGAERRRIFAILRENPALSLVSREAVVEEVAAHEANYRYDPELAQQLAREKIAPLAGRNPDAARIVAACRSLIPADGVAHPAEYRALASIRELLGFERPV